jgi:hypothetical protein
VTPFQSVLPSGLVVVVVKAHHRLDLLDDELGQPEPPPEPPPS